MMELAPGVQEEQQLRASGDFKEEDIQQWRNDTVQQLADAQFSPKEIDEYFGKKEMNTEPLKGQFKANLEKAAAAAEAEKRKVSPNAEVYGPEPVKEADSLLTAIEAGFQMSVSGLIARGRVPDTILPEHASSFYRIASQVGAIVGDLPPIAAGSVAGGIAGTAVGGPGFGSALGAGAGGNALPEAIRASLMEAYTKGEVKSFGDFWERSSSVFLQTLKSGVVGAATFGAGNKVGKIVGGMASPQIVKAGTVAASEIATMVTLGKAMEGQVPEPQDFMDAAVVIAGLHIGTKVGEATYEKTISKLQNIYAKTGNTPSEVASIAMKDPSIQQDLLSTNLEFPNSLDTGEAVGQAVPKELTQMMPGLADEPPIKVRINLAEPKIKEVEKPRELTPDEQTVLSRVVPGDKPTVYPTLNEIYTQVKDEGYPIKEFTLDAAGGKNPDTIDNAYEMYRLLAGNNGRVEQMLKNGTYDFHTLKPVGKSFEAVFKPVEKDLDGWRAYAVSKRALELAEREKSVRTDIDLEAAKRVVESGKGKYEQVSKDFLEFQNHTIQYMVDAELISSKDANTFREANKAYVPFNRFIANDQIKSPGRGIEPKNPIKNIEGSGRKIIDPIESAIRNLYIQVAMAERNRVMLTMKRAAEGYKAGALLMEHLPAKNIEVKVSESEVKALLKEYGIHDIDPTPFSIFRPDKTNLAKDEIVVYSKGKRQIYRVNERVASSIRALDAQDANLLIRMLNIPVRSLRFGVTMSLDFIARNPVRDQPVAWIQSKHGYIPFLSAADGLVEIFRNKEPYQNFLKGGAVNEEIKDLKHYIEDDISKIAKTTGFMNRVHNVVKTPIQLLQVMSMLGERMTRMGDFKKATKDDTSAANIFRSAFDSRELVIDYDRIGANPSIRAMNLITAFWNARLEGLDRTARAMKDDPVGVITKSMASITLVSTLLWFQNHNDKRWNDGSIPRWQKDLFWIVMTDNHVFRIPKPFELGVLFGALPERLLEKFYDHNPEAFKDLSKTFIDGISPGYMPTAVSPFLEHFSNKSFFTNAPIVPHNVEKLLPQDRYSDYTTQSSKEIGKLILKITDKHNNWGSPAIIENYIRAWSGNTGLYALQAADKALIAAGIFDNPHNPAAKIEEWPFIKAFMIKNPTRQNQNIQDFYQRFSDTQEEIESFKKHKSMGDEAGAMKIVEESPHFLKLQTIHNALVKQDATTHKRIQDPSLPPVQKTQEVDGLIEGMIMTATEGLKVYKEFEKEMKQFRKK